MRNELVAALLAATALVAIRWASRPSDEQHMYGHEKAEYFAVLGGQEPAQRAHATDAVQRAPQVALARRVTESRRHRHRTRLLVAGCTDGPLTSGDTSP